MTMKKQNKLGSYLAVTAGVGCAASVAEGAIQVVDLSGVATTEFISLPADTGDISIDLRLATVDSLSGTLVSLTGTSFYGDVDIPFGGESFARGYSAGPAAFPIQSELYAAWFAFGESGGGFQTGLNYVAFKDSADNFGWLSFTLDSLTPNSTEPISSFGHFVYDDTSTSPANAIPLETAIAAVPEPSSLALLALGSVGLAARRQRKKAA